MNKRYVLKLKDVDAYAKLTRLDLDLFRVEPYANPFVAEHYKTLDEAISIANLINSEEVFYKFSSDYEVECALLVVFKEEIIERIEL